ncbi:MAG TPA: cytochrome P450 [Pseudonocardiaceae bacterium]|jgi:hypothetical protein
MSDTTTTAVTEPAVEDFLASLPEGPVRDLYAGAVAGPDPYPVYARLRNAGIITAPEAHVSRYADVQALLRHPDVSSDARNSTAFGLLAPGFQRTLDTRSFVHTDPPDHTRLRSLVTKAFTPRRVEALRPYVQARVDATIDAAAARGSLDIVADLAYPLPVQIICRLLGVPAEDHLDLTERQQLCCFDPSTLAATPAIAEHMRRHRDNDLAYWADIIEARRAHPGEDLVSALIAARDEGDRLTDEALVNTVRLLFVGGHETTVSLIANGMLALLRNPAQLALLRRRPELAGEAVEETLRYDAPFQFVRRTATADLNVNGTTIPAGTQMMVWLAAAGRDPRQFPDPDTFDILRENKRHLGLGGGIHACMGGPLARMQGEIALRTLTTRLTDLAPAPDAPPVYHDDAVHALRSLPVTFAGVRDDRPTPEEA